MIIHPPLTQIHNGFSLSLSHHGLSPSLSLSSTYGSHLSLSYHGVPLISFSISLFSVWFTSLPLLPWGLSLSSRRFLIFFSFLLSPSLSLSLPQSFPLILFIALTLSLFSITTPPSLTILQYSKFSTLQAPYLAWLMADTQNQY